LNSFHFEDQFNTFHSKGYAADPSDFSNPAKRHLQHPRHPASVVHAMSGMHDDEAAPVSEAKRQKTEGAGKWSGFDSSAQVNAAIEKAQQERVQQEVAQKELEADAEVEDETQRVTTEFHGKEETDYQGRSWLSEPRRMDRQKADHQCFMPKKWIHTWSGHTMGVNVIRWFPDSAHLLLSGSMDSKIKIWDFHNKRDCKRTYMGHDQAVRDINFTAAGKKFYSCSYDKNVQLWDTETGQIISTFSNRKIPFCVTPHPHASEEHIFIAGCQNKKAVQWDARTGEIVQEYDEHLAAVNTVTFCEDAKRIVTTSDDKKIFVWDYGIPIVVKYIAEPHMNSIPSITVHPSEKYFAGQSMDNSIVVYEAGGKFKFQPRKKFRGHLNSGYAIKVGFSPDGRWVCSGDAGGRLWFWDWAKCKNHRTFKAHDGVCISSLWHPHQPSRVVTCGWDGLIKLWD